jgi:hypothetical protein
MQQETIKNQIYKRFHIIDDRKTILLHNLGILNHMQNEHSLMQMDLSENRYNYDFYEREKKETGCIDKQIEITTLAHRCIEDMEHLIIETSNVVEMVQSLEDRSEMNILFSDKFSPFIHGISNLGTLFLSKTEYIQELMAKVKLFGKTLQYVLQFDIVIE